MRILIDFKPTLLDFIIFNENHTIKMDIIRYYSQRKSAALKLCNQNIVP